jgi:hypothetical protein
MVPSAGGYGDRGCRLGGPAGVREDRAGAGGEPRVRSPCRFRNRGTEYVSESCIKWMRSRTKRQCNRALGEPQLSSAEGVGLGEVDAYHRGEGRRRAWPTDPLN